MSDEYLIGNARILDGTGAPWFRGAVLVSDGLVNRIFRVPHPDHDVTEVIDVGGKVVCPGFVDTHSHSDLQVFNDAALAPKLRQGITTEVVGQDGLSVAPVPSDATDWADRMRPLAGTGPDVWDWETVAEYYQALDQADLPLHVTTLIGHGTVRYAVMGMADRSPTDDELEAMAAHVRTGLEDGAIGFSTGLVYAPQLHATTREVQRLARELREYGRPFVAHIRGEGSRIWTALDEFIDIGDGETVPLHLSHAKLAGPAQYGKAEQLLSLIESARDRGVDITADQYPYTAGSTMLASLLPPWARTGSAAETVETLREQAARRRMKREIEAGETTEWENVAIRVGWDNIVISSVGSDGNRWMQGKSIAELAEAEDEHPIELVCDLLVEETLDVSMLIHHIDQPDMERILQHRWVAVATDGLFGENPHPRLFGTYPRVLGRYVRERGLLTIEEAVRKMTSLPARAMGLDCKGVLRPGMDADIVVFDPQTVAGPATFDSPTQDPRGIPHVIVGGEFVVRDFEMTGATPGEIVRPPNQ